MTQIYFNTLPGLALLLAAGPASIASIASAQCLTFEESAPNHTNNSMYGSYVEADGPLVVLGHRGWAGTRRGIVYERQGSDWVLVDSLGSGTSITSFSTPVAVSGDTVLVSDIDHAAESGRVHVFQRTAAGLPLMQLIQPATARPDSHFSRRMEIDGERMVIAAPMDATTEYRGGAVFVFERLGGMWTETTRIDPPVSHPFGFFGLGLALDGDTIAIAEPGLLTQGGSSRDVQVYRLQSQAWVLEQRLQPSANGFGLAMAMHDDTLFVGAYQNYVAGSGGTGSVHVYRRTGTTWTEAQVLSMPPTTSGVNFGQTVEWADGKLIIGSGSPELGGGSSDVFVYEEQAGAYGLMEQVQATYPNGGFGTAAALTGDDLWISSPFLAGREGLVERFYLAPPGASYCTPSTLNSSGEIGLLTSSGCATRGANDVSLTVDRLPSFAFGLPLVGVAPGVVPGFFNGLGVLCVGSNGLARGAVFQTSPNGRADFSFDLTAIPTPLGTVVGAPGETWFVQAVYRDTNGAFTSHTTNALELLIR